ncbi:hypothetical protein NDN08_004008 [Rhodosorus marinus]|uniref:Misato Segment II tubulin-like domain-containing protein n=1 Tax=Rhodosorus marinus TaxID=101924 RepID=A0AAV8UH27_9RHOD|nr:hypothetical protein NDN08_004008 [Rhodosorus marinus]
MGRDLIVVQIGSLANFVGAHYWNFQNELFGSAFGGDLSPESLYSESLGGSYRPRALLIDSKGSLGSRPQYHGSHQHVERVDLSWGGASSIHVQERIEPTEFMKSVEEEAGVEGTNLRLPEGELPFSEEFLAYWTDYCKEVFSDRSYLQLDGTFHGRPPALFTNGQELVTAEREDDIVDAFRWQAEQCDNLSGVMTLCESDTGYTGVADSVLTALKDEFPGPPGVTFGCGQRRRSPSKLQSGLNDAWLAAVCARLDQHLIPFSATQWDANTFQHFNLVDVFNPYYSSSTLAVGVEMASLPLRKKEQMSLLELVDRLRTRPSWKVSRADLIFPMRLQQDSPLDLASPAFRSLTPSLGSDLSAVDSRSYQSTVICSRGVAFPSNEDFAESECSEASIIKSSVLPIPVPFPHRFSAAVDRDGNFLDNAASALRMKAKGKDFECESCGVLSVLSADAKGGHQAASNWSRELRMASKKIFPSSSAGIDHAYMLETSELLSDMATDFE